MELLTEEVQRGAVLGGIARAHPVEKVAAERALALALAIEMDAVGVRQQTEAVDHLRVAVEGAQSRPKPAERAGAAATHDAALLPGEPKRVVEPVGAPGAEQAEHRAAADVDDVAAQDVLVDVDRPTVTAEERDMRRFTASRVERAVEANDVVVSVPAGGREEADLRPRLARERQDVVVKERVVTLHRKAAAAKGNNLPRIPHGGSLDSHGQKVFGPTVQTESTACNKRGLSPLLLHPGVGTITVSQFVTPSSSVSSTTVSLPAPQSIVSSVLPSRASIRSSPSPPRRSSAPSPPEIVSLPAPPSTTSSPAAPVRWSSPAPPSTSSAPVWPFARSLPGPASRMSLPLEPDSRSSPVPPDSVSLPVPP